MLFNSHPRPGHKIEFSDLDSPEFISLVRPVNTYLGLNLLTVLSVSLFEVTEETLPIHSLDLVVTTAQERTEFCAYKPRVLIIYIGKTGNSG